MPEPKRNPVFRIVASALAVLKRSGRSAAASKPDTRVWTAQILKQLEWRRFEELCAAYLELAGYSTRIVQSATHTGVDLHLCKPGEDSASILAHCRAWNAYRVGVESVRKLREAMTSARLGEGLLLTSGRFTQEAVAHAGKQNIRLVDGAALLAKFAALSPEQALELLVFATQGDYMTPTCPVCSVKMVARKSTGQGRKYWGCRNYPRCKHTFAADA
jgi:restriction system protein